MFGLVPHHAGLHDGSACGLGPWRGAFWGDDSMIRYAALLRGINVGTARRIGMADLRSLFEELGFTNVRTLLNSGNVIFTTDPAGGVDLERSLEAALEKRFALSVPVAVLSAGEIEQVMAEDPLLEWAENPSRHLVAFCADPAVLGRLRELLAETWAPDRLAVGSRAAYLWCAEGILTSAAAKRLARVGGDAVTTRNWATLLKIRAAVTTP